MFFVRFERTNPATSTWEIFPRLAPLSEEPTFNPALKLIYTSILLHLRDFMLGPMGPLRFSVREVSLLSYFIRCSSDRARLMLPLTHRRQHVRVRPPVLRAPPCSHNLFFGRAFGRRSDRGVASRSADNATTRVADASLAPHANNAKSLAINADNILLRSHSSDRPFSRSSSCCR